MTRYQNALTNKSYQKSKKLFSLVWFRSSLNLFLEDEVVSWYRDAPRDDRLRWYCISTYRWIEVTAQSTVIEIRTMTFLFVYPILFLNDFVEMNSGFWGFNVHKGLERILKGRQQMRKDNSYDWACGEALAFGSLLLEGALFIFILTPIAQILQTRW